jgi:hypothetical protein
MPLAVAVIAGGRSSRPRGLLSSPATAIRRAGTPITRKVPPTMMPPSLPPLESWIAWLVSEAISEVAPVAVKKSPQAKTPKLKLPNRPPRPSRSQGGSPRKAKIAAPISPAKIPAISRRMSVPVPAGQGCEIWYGVLPEAHVPVSSSETSLTLNSTIPPENSPSPSGALIR